MICYVSYFGVPISIYAQGENRFSSGNFRGQHNIKYDAISPAPVLWITGGEPSTWFPPEWQEQRKL